MHLAHVPLLFALGLAALATAQQVCVLRIHEGPEQRAATCTFKQFDMCDFSCICADFDPAQLPQLNGTCSPSPTPPAGGSLGASFLWWTLGFNSFSSDVSFDVLPADTPPAWNTTTQNVSLAYAFSPAQLVPTDFLMKYSGQESKAAVAMAGGWLPCVANAPSAELVSVNVTGPGVVNISWTAPSGAGLCERLVFDVLSSGAVFATGLDSCQNQATVALPLGCGQPYALVLRGYYLHSDGTRGPACTEDSASFNVWVSVPPEPPRFLGANVLLSTRMDVRWVAPASLGGCTAASYVVLLLDTAGNLLYNTSVAAPLTSASLSTPINASRQYTVVVWTDTAPGQSINVTVGVYGTLGQVCHTSEPGRLPTVSSQIAEAAVSSSCALRGACLGVNTVFAPQITFDCTGVGSSASFWFWNLTIDDPATVVMYSIDVQGQPATNETTSTNHSWLRALPPGPAPQFSYIVSYANAAAPSLAGVRLSTIWMPCVLLALSYSISSVLPTVPSNVVLRWTIPFTVGGPCDRLQYAVYVNNDAGVPTVVTTSSGCVATTNITLPRRCEPYTVQVRSNFMLENGTVGAECADNARALTVPVRTRPVSASNLTAMLATNASILISWLSPADLGGCGAYNYSLALVDLYDFRTVIQRTLDSSRTSEALSGLTLRPGGTYRVQLFVLTVVGGSEGATALITVPGSTCLLRQLGGFAFSLDRCAVAQTGACDFSCTCFGYVGSHAPQLDWSCGAPPAAPAFFWWYLGLNSSDYSVRYNASAGAYRYSDTTTSRMAVVDAVPAVQAAASAYGMTYEPTGGQISVGSFVQFQGGWVPCQATMFNATIVDLTDDSGVVNLMWSSPVGAGLCARLAYEVVSSGTVMATNISSCANSTLVTMPLSCDQPYELVLRGYFLFPDNQRGPDCSATSAAMQLSVTEPPSVPLNVGANVLDTTILDTIWQAPATVGGCSTWQYALTLADVDSGAIIATTVVPSSIESLRFTSLTFDPSHRYQMTLGVATAVGRSPNASLPFAGAVGQVCLLYSGGAAEPYSYIYGKSVGQACALRVSCSGAVTGFVPQITYMCENSGFDASFLFWNLTVRSPATTATYNVSLPDGTDYTSNTTTAAVWLAALNAGSAPQPSYVVSAESFDPHIVPAMDFFTGWLPCEPYDMQAAVQPGAPAALWNVTVSWVMPYAQGPCELLQIDLLSEDVTGEKHLLQSVPGCQTRVLQALSRQCAAYLLHVQVRFRFPNGTLGPLCSEQPETLQTLVRSFPGAPSAVSVEMSDSSTLSASWAAPEDLGGCSEYDYVLKIVDLYNSDVVFSARASSARTAAIFVNLSLRAGGSYEFQVFSETLAGLSVAAGAASFTVPGSPFADQGLSPGALAGIILGSFAGAILVVVGVLFYRRWTARRGYRNM